MSGKPKKLRRVCDSQVSSPWTPTRIPELFWGIINFIVLFFQTMVNPDFSKKGSGTTSSYRNPSRGHDPYGGGGGPRRRMGGFGGRGGGGPSSPPMPMGGG